MQIMTGWTIDWSDVAVGVVLLCSLVLLAACARVIQQLHAFDLAADECRDGDWSECHCAGSGHEPMEKPSTCGNCGRYVEIGGE